MNQLISKGIEATYRCIAFFFPQTCICCSEPTENKSAICTGCYSLLLKTMHREITSGERVTSQLSFFDFTDSIRAVIHGLKYSNRPQAAQSILRSAIQKEAMCNNITFDVIVPVPLHWYKELRRGYNQAKVLADVVSIEFEKPVVKALKRVRMGRSQTKKSRIRRAKDIQHAFRPDAKFINTISGATVLLVDDVLTTGATSEECARIIGAMGATEVHLLTLSAVEYA